MRSLLACLLGFASLATVRADITAASPSPPRARLLTPDVFVVGEQPMTLTAFIPQNSLPGGGTPTPASALKVNWIAADRTASAEFQLKSVSAQSVAFDGIDYLVVTYAGLVPGRMAGPVLLESTDLPGARLLVSVQPPAATLHLAKAPENSESPSPAATKDHEETVQVALRRSFIPGIATNEPMYFVLGQRRGLDARFQISFKYQPFDRGWARHLGAAFTTTSVWDLHTESLPFKDSSYRPSISWYTDDRIINDRLRLRWQFAGWEHESNGRGLTNIARTAAGSDSRSINTGFIRPTFVWEVNDHDTLTAALKVYGYYDRASENRDINEYRGYADLLLKYRHDDWVFSTLLRRGHLGYYAELNLGMPMGDFLYLFTRGRRRDQHGWVLFQFLAGYGETMLEYNQPIAEQVRAGLMIVP